jgi:putative hemolysin
VSITYVSIVAGEIVPKRLGQLDPERVARLVARPMHWLSLAARPFVRLLSASTDVALRAFGVRTTGRPGVTEEEIHALLAEGSETGVIEEQERQMVRNLFRLDDRLLGTLMVPRSDIVTLDADAPWAENLAKIRDSRHSRYPVVRGAELDDILGLVTTRMLLIRAQDGAAPDLTRDLVTPLFVPESLTGMEVLQNFRHADTELAIVVDEYGQVLGMVTLRDVLEAIVGEFKPREPGDAWAIPRPDGSWLLDGLIPVPELKDRLRLRSVPEEERHQYHTLSGMLMLLLGRLPRTTDAVEWEGWRFEIVDMDGKQVDKVLASPVPPSGDATRALYP